MTKSKLFISTSDYLILDENVCFSMGLSEKCSWLSKQACGQLSQNGIVPKK